MSVRQETAMENFSKGMNCSQSVLLAFCDKYGLDQESALRVSCGFGGGCRFGEICGAVTGAVMVIGLHKGNRDASDAQAKKACGDMTKEFVGLFRDRNSHVACRDLLECDAPERDRMTKEQQDSLFKAKCTGFVGDAAEILESMGL